MSDLRNGSDNSDIEIVEPVERVEPVIYTRAIDDSHIGERPENLGEFHTVEVEETSNTGRIIGGLAIALMVGAAAVYGYEVSHGSQTSKPVVTQTAANSPMPASTVAAPAEQSAANQTAPIAPSPVLAAPAAPALVAPASQPVQKAPVRSSRSVARSERLSPSSSSAGVPERSAAVQPVYPTAPATSLANNNPSIVAPDLSQDIPAVPNATPAPDAAPVQPAPDQAVQPAPAPDQTARPAQ